MVSRQSQLTVGDTCGIGDGRREMLACENAHPDAAHFTTPATSFRRETMRGSVTLQRLAVHVAKQPTSPQSLLSFSLSSRQGGGLSSRQGGGLASRQGGGLELNFVLQSTFKLPTFSFFSFTPGPRFPHFDQFKPFIISWYTSSPLQTSNFRRICGVV